MKKGSMRIVLETFFLSSEEYFTDFTTVTKISLRKKSMDKYLDIVTSMERIPLPSHATHSQRACVSDGVRASEKRNKKISVSQRENVL